MALLDVYVSRFLAAYIDLPIDNEAGVHLIELDGSGCDVRHSEAPLNFGDRVRSNFHRLINHTRKRWTKNALRFLCDRKYTFPFRRSIMRCSLASDLTSEKIEQARVRSKCQRAL